MRATARNIDRSTDIAARVDAIDWTQATADLGAQGCELAVPRSGHSGAGGTVGVWVADVIRHLGLLNPSLAHSDDSTLTPGQPMSSDVSASDRRTRRIVLSLLTRSPSASTQPRQLRTT